MQHDAPALPAIALLTRAELARALRVCQKSIPNFVKRGILPEPIRLGRAQRWSASAVASALTKLAGGAA